MATLAASKPLTTALIITTAGLDRGFSADCLGALLLTGFSSSGTASLCITGLKSGPPATGNDLATAAVAIGTAALLGKTGLAAALAVGLRSLIWAEAPDRLGAGGFAAIVAGFTGIGLTRRLGIGSVMESRF